MSKRALRRAIGLCAVLITASLLLSGVPVGSTFAFLDGQTQNAGSVFAAGWIAPPTAGTATASGYDVGFTWTPGTTGLTGQQLWGVDHTTTNNCTGVTYSSLATLASSTTAAYTDSNRGSTINGDWYCYELLSTSASSWTAPPLVLPALQVGLVANAIVITNVLTLGSIANGDKIAITFNQATNIAAVAGTLRVCAWAGAGVAGSIVLGDTTGACTNANDNNNIGKITNIAVGTTRTFATSTSTIAGSTVTITLGGGTASTESGATAKFTPSTSATTPVKSAATTDQATACTAATTNCQPTTATTF
jgi:hypothetical protein